MIEYQNNTIHIRAGTFSYIMRVLADGRLLHVYWGDALPPGAEAGIDPPAWDGASFDRRQSRERLELPTQEGGYYGTPAVAVLNPAGDDVLQLRFENAEIVAGKPDIPGLPSAYCEAGDEAQTLVLTLRDALSGLRVQAFYTVWRDFDVLARHVALTNEGREALRVTRLYPAVAHVFGDDWEVVHLKGGWARERRVTRQPVGGAHVAIDSKRGASGHEASPFIALTARDTSEHCGAVYAQTLVYSGSFAAYAECGNFADTRMGIGMNPATFQWLLSPGETLHSPEALLVYANDGLNGMSQRAHALIARRVCAGVWRDRARPVLINNWEATYFDFDEEKLLQIARRGAQIGCELFVLDDGWFGKRNDDRSSLGDWTVNRDKLPGGIERLARSINDLGLMFGIWVEPEMVSPDSALYRAHPDWCLHVAGRARTEARQQLILDMGREEVRAYVLSSLDTLLRGAPIGYVKWDMNRNMTEAFSASLPSERKMESQHRYILGLYSVLDALTKRFPQVLFEGCSGGGGRFDCGILRYMPQIWTSDNTDAVARVEIQYGTSLLYPPCVMGAHVSAVPNHMTRRVTDMHMRAGVALSGTFGFEMDLSRMSPEETEQAKACVDFVKENRAWMQRAVFTRLVSPLTGELTAWQFVCNDDVLLCCFRTLTRANPAPQRVRLRGLESEALYQPLSVPEGARNTPVHGAALMHYGVALPRQAHDFECLIYRFVRRNQ